MRWPLLLLAALPAICPAGAKADQGYHCSAGRQESWYYNEFPKGDLREIRLRGSDEIRLDGARIGREALGRHLEQSGRASVPAIFTILAYDEKTDCGLVQAVRVAMTRGLPCHQRGWCGEHFTTAVPLPPLTKEELARRMAEAETGLEAAAEEVRGELDQGQAPPKRR